MAAAVSITLYLCKQKKCSQTICEYQDGAAAKITWVKAALHQEVCFLPMDFYLELGATAGQLIWDAAVWNADSSIKKEYLLTK
ncbi:MAG: hypothetical protein R8G34_18635 [Paracoccaceae bacterium]|nr:hypothetical protein [Paracoccaceae bacterium]